MAPTSQLPARSVQSIEPRRESRSVLINPPAREIGRHHAILWGRGRRSYDVANFVGALSIKSVVEGQCLWETEEGRYVVDRRSHLILNDGQAYSIRIDSREPVETFCVFFQRGFVEDAFRSLTKPGERLLDDPNGGRLVALGFPESLSPADPRIRRTLGRVRQALLEGRSSNLWLEERFYDLAQGLLRGRSGIEREMARVAAVKPATRAALHRQLRRSRDFIEGSFLVPRLTVARVAQEAGLSLHHFHRLFTQVFRETPHRYIIRRRLERAQDLLVSTDWPVTEVCLETGFESPGSFSWLFHRRLGVSPRQFRLAHKKSKTREEPRRERGGESPRG